MKIIVSQEIEQVCPGFIGAAVEAQVMNTPYCEELWKEIHALGEEYRSTLRPLGPPDGCIRSAEKIPVVTVLLLRR